MANQFVAYQDERHGLAAWVAEQVAADLFRNPLPTTAVAEAPGGEGVQVDAAGMPAFTAETYGMRLTAGGNARPSASFGADASPAAPARQLDHAYRTWTSPRSSADQTVAAVVGRQAQVGIVPFYDHDQSFARETLEALMDFPGTQILREYVAESNYVLAAPTDLIHEIEQSGFTNSFAKTGDGSQFAWNAEKQQRYLRKVTTIYASAEAMRQCAAALDGFRARGIDIQQIPDGVDTYREGLRLGAELLDPRRKVETKFSQNEHVRVSKSIGANHNKPLIAVLLSADRAQSAGAFPHDQDYAVLEAEMAGADRIRTSFLALTRRPDPAPGGKKPKGPKKSPLATEMASFGKVFAPPSPAAGKSGGGKAPTDHRALYPLPGVDDGAGGASRSGGAKGGPSLLRVLYAFDTVGEKVADISPVLKALAENHFSYMTTTLDNRPGHPMVVAIDVPKSHWRAMEPVLKEILKMSRVSKLGAFPAVRPMVAAAIRPAKPTNERRQTMAIAASLLIVAVVAGYGLFAGLT